MNNVDIVSIILALIAIVISIISIYLQYQKVSKLTLRLVQFNYPSESPTIELTYFIGNTGNVEWYLNEVSVLIHAFAKSHTTKMSIDLENVPTIVHTNKVNLIKIICPTIAYLTAEKGIDDILPNHGYDDKAFGIYVKFDFLSPNGEALSYLANLKGLISDKDRSGSYWKAVCLDELDSFSSEYHKVIKN